MGKIENIIRIVEQRKGTLKGKDVPASLIKRMEDLYGKFDYKNEDLTEPIDYDGTILHKFERLLKKNILCYKDLGSLFRIKIIYLQIFAFIKNKIL